MEITMNQRRNFLLKTSSTALVAGFTLAGCTTTANSAAGNNPAARRHNIDAGVDATLAKLYGTVHGSHELVEKAQGLLVFPSVLAAGFWVGGQYGEGALRINGATAGYYSTASASLGLQIGAQSKAIIFLFMNEHSLADFRRSRGWSAGGDASVAVLKVGANGNVDTTTATAPVLAFVLTNGGLMANLSLEGTKVSRLDL
jgi:lipid-binding SYLF domain-containing protein